MSFTQLSTHNVKKIKARAHVLTMGSSCLQLVLTGDDDLEIQIFNLPVECVYRIAEAINAAQRAEVVALPEEEAA